MRHRNFAIMGACATSLLAGWALAGLDQARGQTRISQMPAATTLTGSELVPVVQGGANAVTTPAAIGAYVQGALGPWPALSGTPTAGHCVEWLSATTLEDAGAACGTGSGGGGTPGGSSGQLQFNSAGAFGGFTLTGDCALSEPAITCTKTNGAAFAASATTDTTNAANITTGLMATARLGSGSAGAAYFLRGDSVWALISAICASNPYVVGSTDIWTAIGVPTSTAFPEGTFYLRTDYGDTYRYRNASAAEGPGWQPLSTLRTFQQAGTTIESDPQAVNCSTGVTCTTSSAGVVTITASGSGGTVVTSGSPTSGQVAVFSGATAIAGVTPTGSGAPVLATSPTLVTPALGTPASGVLTNTTGLPLTTGVTGVLPVANGGSGVANTGNLTWNAAQTLSFTSGQTMTFPAATATLAGLGTSQTFSGADTFSFAPAASQSAITVTGAPYTAGSATTNFPAIYYNCSGSSAPTTFNTGGTYLGINACSGFIGSLIDARLNGGNSAFSVGYNGGITATYINISTNQVYGWGGRGLISSPSVNAVQIGNTDAASPSAQTLRSQGVVTGTSNTAGANFTILAGPGTGTGAGGSLIFQTAPAAGTSGSTQNAGQTVLTLDAKSHAGFSSAAIPTLSSCGSGSPTVTARSTDNAGAFTVGTTASACTLTFKQTFTNAPFCVLSDITLQADLLSYTISTSAIVLSMTANSGDVVDYICNGN